jgi:hypothetical protein
MTISFVPYKSADQNAAVPAIRGQAFSTAQTTYGFGRIRVLGTAKSAVVGHGKIASPLGRALDRNPGAYGVGKAPIVYAHGSSTAVVPTVAVGSSSVPMVFNRSIGIAYGNQNTAAPRILSRSLAVGDKPSGIAIGRVPIARGFANYISAPKNYFYVLPAAGFTSITFGTPINALTDSFQATDSLESSFILALLDYMHISDSAAALSKVLASLLDGMSLRDVARYIIREGLVDHFLASAATAGTAQITVFLSDSFVVEDGTSAVSQVLQALRDGFCAIVSLSDGNDAYTAWVMTTDTRAMRSYSNLQFNSYTMFNGQMLAAGADGVHVMGGTTDAGVAIQSFLRTGMLDFGDPGHLKQIQRAYLGAATTGQLVLGIEANTFDGQVVKQTYVMTPTTGSVLHRQRVDVGRGFRSVYWTFELVSEETATQFQLTDITVIPMTLTGRVF